jgi:hypothetical protein
MTLHVKTESSRRRVTSCYCFACKNRKQEITYRRQDYILGNSDIVGGTTSSAVNQTSQAERHPRLSVRYHRQDYNLGNQSDYCKRDYVLGNSISQAGLYLGDYYFT